LKRNENGRTELDSFYRIVQGSGKWRDKMACRMARRMKPGDWMRDNRV
jgi:hypothetical protein